MIDLTKATGAIFSEDKKHRFVLWRYWKPGRPLVLFIGLNPSRAGEFYNDPTIRRCISFAKRDGYGGMLFGNLFSLRSTNPVVIKNDREAANHPSHYTLLTGMLHLCSTVVPCWGSWDFIEAAELKVHSLIQAAGKPVMCFGRNKDGTPKHPLYLKSDCELVPYTRIVNTIQSTV